MSKKFKQENFAIMACCANCRNWKRIGATEFGLCLKIKVGVDVRTCGRALQTGRNFMCMYNSPLEVEIVETKNSNENDDNTENIATD